MLGVFLGGLTSALLSGGFRLTRLPHSPQWRSVFGGHWAVRWGLVFLSGMLIQVAARIAGGCTSGLAISGGVQLAPAAFVFIPALFLSGTLTALLVYRRSY
ncbi:MAG: YeeE/YedE family protein [Anaerolineae bacterium]|nr:YeeE/YedE family protein [Anaerolineae bacterium]